MLGKCTRAECEEEEESVFEGKLKFLTFPSFFSDKKVGRQELLLMIWFRA
jgi:hypothetical protein